MEKEITVSEKTIKGTITKIFTKVKSLVIEDQPSYEIAVDYGNQLKKIEAEIKAYWKDPVEKQKAAYKSVTDKRDEMLDPVTAELERLRNSCKIFLAVEKRRREEEQRKLDEERVRKDEAERKKLEERAIKAESAGKTDKAADLFEKAADVYTPPAFVENTVKRVETASGAKASTREDVEVEIINMLEFLKAVCSGTIQLNIAAITVSKSQLKAFVKSSGITNIPGCNIKKIDLAVFGR